MKQHQKKRLIIQTSVQGGSQGTACDFLTVESGLSKSRIKDAMNKGAVWIKKKGKMQRLRKATTPLAAGDQIELHYDENLLSIRPSEARLIEDREFYSAWFKPAGLMAQGTMYGDHCSLLRQAELFFTMQRKVFLLHRLDREATGVMLIAHSKEAAARLSELFQKKEITKEYLIEVLGRFSEANMKGVLKLPLDGREAITDYEVQSFDDSRNTSYVSAFIKTGRLHQIRRHFEMIGHPIIGDPKYGSGNKNKDGMKLTAVSLRFRCPFTRKDVKIILPKDLWPGINKGE
jgi:tRNA pseudouridine32 synthase/23S rRNA pseudouridine746 synthase